MKLLDKVTPFWVPSKELWNIEVGEVFRDDVGLYRLLYRDAFKAKVIECNWFTDMFWGRKFEHGSKVTN